MFTPQLNLIILPQHTDTLNGYPSPVHPVLSVNWSTFLEGILPPLKSLLEQWLQWRVSIGRWGPNIAYTVSVAY